MVQGFRVDDVGGWRKAYSMYDPRAAILILQGV